MTGTIRDLEDQLAAITDIRQKIDRMNALAWELKSSNLSYARTLSKKAYALVTQGEYEDQPYEKGLAESLRNLGYCNIRQAHYDLALSQLLEALSLFEKLGDLSGQAEALNYIGNVYLSVGNYPDSLEYTLRTLDIRQILHDQAGEALALNNLGYLYLYMQDCPKALDYLQQCLQLSREIGYTEAEAHALDNSCNLYCALKEYDKALRCGFKSLQLYRKLGNALAEAEALNSIGDVYQAQGNLSQALSSFHNALHISQELGNQFEVVMALLRIGRVYHQQEKMMEALSSLQQALTIATDIGSKRLQIECHEALASVYKHLGNFETALVHYEQFHTIKEEAFSEEAEHKIKTLEIIHQTETTRKEAEIYQLRNVELEQEIAERKRAEDRATHRASEMTTLVEIGQDISATLDLPTVLERIASRAKELVRANTIAIYLQQANEETFSCLVALGEKAEHLKAHVVQPGQGIMGDVLQHGVAEIIEHAEQDPRAIIIPGTVTSGSETLLCAPLITEQKVIGLITLWRTGETESFTSADLNFVIGLSQQAAIAIQNARLFHEAQQAKEEAEQARRVAEMANNAKSIFIANMSHELRTPLNAILGFSRLIARNHNLDLEQQDNLRTIHRSGEHLLTLINQVLDLSKIEAGRITINEREFDLHRLLNELEDMFSLKAEDKHLQLVFERVDNVPQYVRTDEIKLRQVLINLLNNAIKFTEEGGVSVRINSRQSAVNSQQSVSLDGEAGTANCQLSTANLFFEVSDTGPGIVPDELDSLFEPFVQTESGRKVQEGTGLGLPISRKFAQLMGGDMTVSSELRRGTTFMFDIQVDVVGAIDITAKQSSRQIIALEPDQPCYRLLIADDKPDNRKLLVKLLAPLGFELREASNGQEAIALWEEFEPHLIWMDIRMPVMDGYEATRRIKATTKGQTTVVIAVTASSFEEERAVVLSAGCDDFLRKPFREAEIFEMMHKHLGVRFVYEEEEQVAGRRSQVADQESLTPETLAALPNELRIDLQQAIEELNVDMTRRLIDQICQQNKPLADALAELVEDFRFDILQKLFENIEE